MPFRSTKGASKQRRDQINDLVMELRSLLPLHESTRQRLSQLQVMSLLCVQMRKNNMFHTAEQNRNGSDWIPDDLREDFMKNLPGFLLVVSKDGNLIYVSENVTDFLGHSMVDMMTQGDSVYDIVDGRDHSGVKARLDEGWGRRGTTDAHTTFFCRMNVARTLRRPCNYREQKVMTVRGQFAPLSADSEDCAFVAVCSPLLTPEVKDSVYRSATDLVWMEHSLDMKIQACSSHSLQHLGYTQHELAGKSLYELLHPDDLPEAKQLHMRALKLSVDQGVMLAARLQTASGAWQPVSTVITQQQGVDGQRKLLSVHSLIKPEDFAAYVDQSHAYNEQARLLPYSVARAMQNSPRQGAEAELDAPATFMDNPTASFLEAPGAPLLDDLFSQFVRPAHLSDVEPDNDMEFKPSGLALKRKLAEPRVNYAHKSIKLDHDLRGGDWDSQPDMVDLLTQGTESTEPTPVWTAQVSSVPLAMTPERQTEDIDLGEILNLPSFQQELPSYQHDMLVPSDSPAPSSVGSPQSLPAWLPPSPPQGSPSHSSFPEMKPQRPIVPLVHRRLLPEMGVNDIIHFFEDVHDLQDVRIPTTVMSLQTEALCVSPPLKPLQRAADPRALQLNTADLLQKQESAPVQYSSLLEEVFSESEGESLIESYEQMQGCQSLLRFLHEPLMGAELDAAIEGF